MVILIQWHFQVSICVARASDTTKPKVKLIAASRSVTWNGWFLEPSYQLLVSVTLLVCQGLNRRQKHEVLTYQ